jgi:isocitrate lyase
VVVVASSPTGDAGFIDYFLPIVADAEAGFGGVLNAFELMKNMIAAGAAGVHFEDQLACRQEVRPHGRQGARAQLREAVEKLISARFAADVMGVPTLILGPYRRRSRQPDHLRP